MPPVDEAQDQLQRTHQILGNDIDAQAGHDWQAYLNSRPTAEDAQQLDAAVQEWDTFDPAIEGDLSLDEYLASRPDESATPDYFDNNRQQQEDISLAESNRGEPSLKEVILELGEATFYGNSKDKDYGKYYNSLRGQLKRAKHQELLKYQQPGERPERVAERAKLLELKVDTEILEAARLTGMVQLEKALKGIINVPANLSLNPNQTDPQLKAAEDFARLMGDKYASLLPKDAAKEHRESYNKGIKQQLINREAYIRVSSAVNEVTEMDPLTVNIDEIKTAALDAERILGEQLKNLPKELQKDYFDLIRYQLWQTMSQVGSRRAATRAPAATQTQNPATPKVEPQPTRPKTASQENVTERDPNIYHSSNANRMVGKLVLDTTDAGLSYKGIQESEILPPPNQRLRRVGRAARKIASLGADQLVLHKPSPRHEYKSDAALGIDPTATPAEKNAADVVPEPADIIDGAYAMPAAAEATASKTEIAEWLRNTLDYYAVNDQISDDDLYNKGILTEVVRQYAERHKVGAWEALSPDNRQRAVDFMGETIKQKRSARSADSPSS